MRWFDSTTELIIWAVVMDLSKRYFTHPVEVFDWVDHKYFDVLQRFVFFLPSTDEAGREMSYYFVWLTLWRHFDSGFELMVDYRPIIYVTIQWHNTLAVANQTNKLEKSHFKLLNYAVHVMSFQYVVNCLLWKCIYNDRFVWYWKQGEYYHRLIFGVKSPL